MALVRNSNADDANDLLTLSKKFLTSYYLVSRWQHNLEFFLFNFCRIKTPKIIAECHWPCHEAAELTRLSEKITEYYCFHHKRNFEKSGISAEERERFCAELWEIRQLRNAAVHRVPLNATTIKRYARSALGVLKIVRRLGGKGFEEAYGESLDHLFHSFWDVESNLHANMLSSGPLQTEGGQDPLESLSAEEKKRNNIETAMEKQRSAERRRAINIGNMVEDFQVSQDKRAVNQQCALQMEEAATKAKAERAQKAKDQEAVAGQAKRERLCKAEALQIAAEEQKRIRQQTQELMRTVADGKIEERRMRALQIEEAATKARAERAQKAKDQEAAAGQAKRERLCKAEALQIAAEEQKRIRQQKQELMRTVADRKIEERRMRAGLQQAGHGSTSLREDVINPATVLNIAAADAD